MSQSVRGFERTGVASEDLSSSQYYIVQMDSTGGIEIAESATDFIVGVLQNKPASGEAATYRFLGTSKVKAGGTVAIGAWVTAASDGEAVSTTTDGNITIGRALEAAVDQDVFEIQLSIQHLYIA